MSRLPLRVRLVAGFSAAMLVLLAAAGAFVYWRVEYALDRGLDTELSSAVGVVAPLVGADGSVSARDAADATGAAWQVLDSNGRVLDSGGPAPGTALVLGARLDEVTDREPRIFDVGSLLPVSDHPYRVRVSALTDTSTDTSTDTGSGEQAAYLLVGVRRDHRDEALRELLAQLALAGFGALVIASLVGDQLARRALRPVERYRRRAAEIATGASTLRLDVPESRDDEVTRLGHTLNDMLAAQEASLDRERQFVHDASHELRTPLTLLRSRIQLARRRRRTVEEHERVLDELTIDVARLADLTEQLLDLNHNDATAAWSDGAAVTRVVVERWQAAQPERAWEVRWEAPVEVMSARLDPSAMERVVTNLLSNALLHGCPPVHLSVRCEAGHIVLQVTDAGPGMAPELLAQATRRFTRAPEARSRPGAGLGLSIVEQLVAGAGGELRLCCGGHHASSGVPTAVRCRHDDSMTVSVIVTAIESEPPGPAA